MAQEKIKNKNQIGQKQRSSRQSVEAVQELSILRKKWKIYD